MTNWFGEDWGAPINRDCPRCDTPVGALCVRCVVAIKDGDQGVTMPMLLAGGIMGVAAYHQTCFVKTVADHKTWPQLGLVPEASDGFIPTEDATAVTCPVCGMTYSHTLKRWL